MSLAHTSVSLPVMPPTAVSITVTCHFTLSEEPMHVTQTMVIMYSVHLVVY